MSGLRKRGTWARVLFAGGLVFLLQEAALRIVFPLPEVSNFDRSGYSPMRVDDGRGPQALGHASFLWYSEPDGAKSLHRLNLYGFRDREWQMAPERPGERLIFLGDSMVEGYLAAESETIPARFEDRAVRDGRSLEVMNFGVGAASPKQYARLLRDALPLFTPDHVVLVLFANDLDGSPYDPDWLAHPLEPDYVDPWLPRFAYVLPKVIEGERVPRRWMSAPFPFFRPVPDPRNPWSDERGRQFAAIVHPSIADAMRRGVFNPFNVNELALYETSLKASVDLGPHLRAFRDYAARHRSTLSVAYIPHRSQVSDRYLPYQHRYSKAPADLSLTGPEYRRHARMLGEVCGDLELPFLDLTGVLAEREAAGEPVYWDYDEHLRPEGYRLVADAIYGWWIRNAAIQRSR